MRLLMIPLRHGWRALREMRSEFRQLSAPMKLNGADRLQLGAGEQILEDWANLDLEGGGIAWDLTRPIPVEKGSVRLVYSEHFIEHVSRGDAQRILQNCHAIMAPGGTIRISTPDLKKLVDDYQSGNLVAMSHGGWFPETPCSMVNEAMHLWGHQFVYDEAELSNALREAGFKNIRRMKWHESAIPELANLESRPDMGDLILEADAS